MTNRINELRKEQLREENPYGLDRMIACHSLIIVDNTFFDYGFARYFPKNFDKTLENALRRKNPNNFSNHIYIKKLKEFFELYDNIRVPKEVIEELRACFYLKDQKEYVNKARRELLEVIISRPRTLKLTDEENEIFSKISNGLEFLKKDFEISETDYSILCYCISLKDANKALATNDIPLIRATSSAAIIEKQTLTIYSSIGDNGRYHKSRIFKNGKCLFYFIPTSGAIKPINRL